jgi:chemotaxis protein methyltransferase CheR
MPLPTEPVTLLVPQGVPELLRDLVHEHTGIYFESDRFDTLLEKLRGRALHHGCHSYLDYYYILKYEEKGHAEWLRVMDAFSVQETYFWREASQIRALVDLVIPQWFERNPGPFRIWSAACASGEEPYSIVMALLEAGLGSRPIEIVASDGSEAALERAKLGLYRERSFRSLSPELREKYFTRVPEGWQLDRDVLRRVSLRRANIVAPGEIFDLAHSHVVFCRNVFIYFSTDAIRRTVDSFASCMSEGAHLFVGSSESLLRVTPDFELREINDAFGYIRKPRSLAGTP